MAAYVADALDVETEEAVGMAEAVEAAENVGAKASLQCTPIDILLQNVMSPSMNRRRRLARCVINRKWRSGKNWLYFTTPDQMDHTRTTTSMITLGGKYSRNELIPEDIAMSGGVD